MTSTPSKAFDALERDLLAAAERLSLSAARRRRRGAIGAVLVASLLAMTGAAAATGLVRIPISPADDPTANHAASAMRLTQAEARVLLKAQELGNIAKACQIAHGAKPVNGGLDDPTGQAAAACKAENDANESFLNSADFRAVEAAMLPRIMEAARCFQRYTGIKPGTMIEENGKLAAPQKDIDAGNAACFQPNGLPK